VQESFEHVREWLKEVDRYAAPETCKLLIGNKSDRTDKVVSEAEGQALANELKMPFLETSARTAENVEAAFIRMADQLIKLR
jgi:Ras-related protein Rab-1A